MKKVLISLLIAFSCFFFFDMNFLKAESVVITDLDNYGVSPLGENFTGKYFNYFNEKYNNTEFYRMLTGISISSHFPGNYGKFISIFTADEVCYIYPSSDVCNNINLYSANYVVLGSETLPTIKAEENSLFFSGWPTISNFYYILFKDSTFLYSSYSNAIKNILYEYNFSYYWYNSPWWQFWKSDSYMGSDFGIFLSKF